ncbi:MAG: hypothetical protein U5K43_14905 [Halofilum sp. (in: g-proteobacteria)]|nr:hypothetical protein [Halofilum sp. (in: g-proteobacteria)]
MARRTCPATGTDVLTAWAAERAALGPLPEPLPEPFDVAVTRRVAPDCTVVFEGRTLLGAILPGRQPRRDPRRRPRRPDPA